MGLPGLSSVLPFFLGLRPKIEYHTSLPVGERTILNRGRLVFRREAFIHRIPKPERLAKLPHSPLT